MRLKTIKLIPLILGLTLCVSCTGSWHQIMGDNTRKGVSSSLVDYLYPKGETPPKFDESVPNLSLPLRVGLAFVPAASNDVQGLSEAHKADLLEKTKEAFRGREFIKDIMIIPDTYMRGGQGFEGVDQIARLYSLDVIALVSYDQVSHVDDTKASILYWTVVGAYFIKGSKNDVQTFVDTAIFDVSSHKLLFRAPGVNSIKDTSTLINSPEKMRKSREESFNLAMADMTANLNKELDAFKERVKKEKMVTISHREGYKGGSGAFDPGIILILLAMVGAEKLLNFSNKIRRSSGTHESKSAG
ncbi:MAG: rhombotarget lipoprotein [Desulfobacteraceae bacterium]|nr:rhombotarget lipoprotein [Desulfobacteraceae bacterium]MBU4001217.1 rhombotarget lipoprotein [Pseudomonadota bacterium]